jgi:hypothetical protein
MIDVEHTSRPVAEVLDELGEYVMPRFRRADALRRHRLCRGLIGHPARHRLGPTRGPREQEAHDAGTDEQEDRGDERRVVAAGRVVYDAGQPCAQCGTNLVRQEDQAEQGWLPVFGMLFGRRRTRGPAGPGSGRGRRRRAPRRRAARRTTARSGRRTGRPPAPRAAARCRTPGSSPWRSARSHRGTRRTAPPTSSRTHRTTAGRPRRREARRRRPRRRPRA